VRIDRDMLLMSRTGVEHSAGRDSSWVGPAVIVGDFELRKAGGANRPESGAYECPATYTCHAAASGCTSFLSTPEKPLYTPLLDHRNHVQTGRVPHESL
jgi:hypothetical protein